jgi:sigma-B regulation protein RsbU (phosphoserine phosphatase)
MLVIFGLASVMPIILMAVLSYNKARMMLVLPPQDVIGSLLYLTAFLLVVALATAIYLSGTFSNSIIAPVRRMENAMVKVEAGDFTAFVPVDTNDELGALAEHFNQMTEGLKERYRLRRSLDLAKEVQQNLLPKANPVVAGLDIAGKSVYCDETGGDYYDFISIGENDKHQIGVAIGDVSGHGISSALLMATVRSSLRQRASLTGTIAQIMSDVNRQLVQDVEDSGQFMTMFFLTLNTATRQLEWVRAGHDPGIVYDPGSDSFGELGGPGIALGVDAEWVYEDNKKTDFSKGQIIILSTDGIWEARNKKGEMLGKEPILSAIRKNSSSGATQIIDSIFNTLNTFSDGVKIEDDITAVVIKMLI